MARKVYVNVTTSLIINVNEGQDVDEVLQEMNYNFEASPFTDATIEDSEITDWVITNSHESYEV